jgi:2-keto-4-pentenoate hydratase/2-oxohepta-3-ene-1,7-dioic acid hydratase in catechol pathway
MDYVGGYVAVLDLTGMRSGFDQMSAGLSWTRNKICAGFKPMSRFISKSEIADPHQLTMVCKVNGAIVTEDSTSTLKFSIPEQIADASSLTPLLRGDVILIGSGKLGPLAVGDLVEGYIEGLHHYNVTAKLVRKTAL